MRTVSDRTGFAPNWEMSTIGYITGAIVMVLILPLLPALGLIWIAWRVGRAVRSDGPLSWPNAPA